MPERSQPLIWHSLNIFRALCCRMEHERAVALGGRLGSLVARFSQKKVSEAVERCMKILGVPRARAEEIVRGAYEHFGRAAAEFARMPVMAERIDELVSSEGHEYLFDAVKSGRGAMLATAHIGNWEYSACWLARHGLPINSLGADQRDERITELIKELRRAGGAKALGKANDLKAMIKALQRGEVIAVPVDQDAKEAGIVSPFLGYPASTPLGPAKLAAKLGCDVIPGICTRNPDGVTFSMKFYPPMRGRDGEPFGKNIQTSTDDLNAVISEGIKAHPEQWMWMYPRWESVERGIFNDRGN